MSKNANVAIYGFHISVNTGVIWKKFTLWKSKSFFSKILININWAILIITSGGTPLSFCPSCDSFYGLANFEPHHFPKLKLIEKINKN